MGAQPRPQLLSYDKNNRNGNVKHKTKHLVIRKAYADTAYLNRLCLEISSKTVGPIAVDCLSVCC